MTAINKLKEYSELVKLEHTIFALPFTLSGMMLAKNTLWPSLSTFFWVILAMISGRIAAMALNRLIDKDIDKLNPRTKERGIPAGRVSIPVVVFMISFSLLVMIISVFQLPLICINLLPAAIILIAIYSYMKRFSYFSHFILGLVLGAAGTGGWIAVSASLTLPSILWGCAITLWVAGFDIIYSLLDIDFDKEQGLHSIPSKFGSGKALLISRTCHYTSILLFLMTGYLNGNSALYFTGVLFAAVMIAWEQSLVKENDFSKVDFSFFTLNGYVSIGMFLFILAETLVNSF